VSIADATWQLFRYQGVTNNKNTAGAFALSGKPGYHVEVRPVERFAGARAAQALSVFAVKQLEEMI